MAYFSSRVVLLTFLYFIQGLPYGLQARFLPVYLRTKGHSLTNLGLFKMLLAPWLCKALWAPLVDKYASKQKWLLWSISGLMVTCAVTSMIPPDNILLLCLCIFSLNLFAATQDIVVDSIALTILPPDELGKGNTAQVVGYKIGAIFGGGILVWFMDVLGWRGLFIALTLLYIEALLFVYLSPTLRVLKRLEVWKEPVNSPSSGTEKGKQKLETPSDDIPKDPEPQKDFVQKTEKLKTTRSDLSEKVDPIKPEEQNSHNSKDTQREDVSALIKSALEFLETKDDLERNLELRHDLRVEELGTEQQKEIIKEIVDACPLLPPVPSKQEVAKDEGDAQDNSPDKDKTETDIKDVAGEEEADKSASKTDSLDEPEVKEGKQEKVPNDNRETNAADLPGELVLSGGQREAVHNADKKSGAATIDSPDKIVENGDLSKSSSDNEKATGRAPEIDSAEALKMDAAQKEASDGSRQTSAPEEETSSETLENGDQPEPFDDYIKAKAAELDSPEERELNGVQQHASNDDKTSRAAVTGSRGEMEVDGDTAQTSDGGNQKAASAQSSHLEPSDLEPSADAPPGVEELGYLDDDASEDHESVTDPDDSASGSESASDEESDSGNLQGLNEELLDDNVFLQEGEEVVKESDDEDRFTCSSVRVSGRFAFLWDVIMVPNTLWIMVYVIIYKLGEQGAVGMLPLFLVDHDVNTVDVTFWTGVIGQATSMLGSCLGGWILSHPVYKMPCRLLIYQLSLCRLLPLGLLLWVVLLWSGAVLPPTILYRAAIVAMNLLLLVSGMVTTATFTLMMECSQTAPRGVQATHYTLLSSMEVFGKLTFMSVCGALVDYFGYTTMYLSFVILSAAILPWLWRYPDILCEKKMS